MTGVAELSVAGWGDVQKIAVDDWLWLDMAEGGLHRGSLPGTMPSQLSHVWGWSARHLVRLRFDRDLPNGVVGAEIPVAEAGNPSEVMLWRNSGKIRMNVSDFHGSDGAARVRLEEFIVTVESRDDHGLVRMPISFYRMSDL